MYQPRTSSEINIHRIQTALKKIKNRTLTVQEASLDKRFQRLKKVNPYMYEELYQEYINIVKANSFSYNH
jgi:hypothetical protein